jgi:hypothetical protein
MSDSLPSDAPFTRTPAPEWWLRLGLSASDPAGNSANDPLVQEAKDRILRTHRPVLFAVETDNGPTAQKTLDQVVADLDAAKRGAEFAVQDAAHRREQRGRDAMMAALAAPDADDLVTTGEWAGFTRGRAIAWCWNLYQFEPHGFVPPNSIVRQRNVRALESGDIPNGFGYADRARELEAGGTTPAVYRTLKVTQGAPTFSEDDVRFGSR